MKRIHKSILILSCSLCFSCCKEVTANCDTATYKSASTQTISDESISCSGYNATESGVSNILDGDSATYFEATTLGGEKGFEAVDIYFPMQYIDYITMLSSDAGGGTDQSFLSSNIISNDNKVKFIANSISTSEASYNCSPAKIGIGQTCNMLKIYISSEGVRNFRIYDIKIYNGSGDAISFIE